MKTPIILLGLTTLLAGAAIELIAQNNGPSVVYPSNLPRSANVPDSIPPPLTIAYEGPQKSQVRLDGSTLDVVWYTPRTDTPVDTQSLDQYYKNEYKTILSADQIQIFNEWVSSYKVLGLPETYAVKMFPVKDITAPNQPVFQYKLIVQQGDQSHTITWTSMQDAQAVTPATNQLNQLCTSVLALRIRQKQAQ